jgi:4-hydroxybenzoate polyprenyltransferase
VAAVAAFSGNPLEMYSSSLFWVWFLYFLFPANFLIYGINDFADQDTDALNFKKDQYETKYSFKSNKLFFISLGLFNLPFLIFLNSWLEFAVLCLFWLLSVFYSLEPIRAKSKPFIDSAFNFLYVISAIFGYIVLGGNWQDINWLLFIAAGLWCMSMHTFSAIPDIQADQLAKLKTTAVVLGLKGAVIYCGILFSLSALISGFLYSWIMFLFLVPYVVALIISYRKNSQIEVFKIYKYFPYYNGFVGFCIFWTVVIKLYLSL